jgi:Tfp pilus assembly protein PilV
MNSKTKNGLIVTVVVLGLVSVLYFSFFNKKSSTTTSQLQQLIDKIWSNMVSNNVALQPYKSQYQISLKGQPLALLMAWSSAIDNGASTYTYNNTTYDTASGVGQ